MTETQSRFVLAILDRLPEGRVVEMHVFPPLRQGAVETGMAVIAARYEGPEHIALPAGERHTVFTARYVLTIRGAERGKWEFDLVEEADAPLVTVDAVVRGVQDRAGEGGEPERIGADALAALATATAAAPWTTAR